MLEPDRERWNCISAKKDEKQGLVSFNNLDRKGKKCKLEQNMDRSESTNPGH